MFVYDFPPWAEAAGLNVDLLLTLPPTGTASWPTAPTARPPPQMPPLPRQPSMHRVPSFDRSRSPPPQPPTRSPSWGVGPFVTGAAVLYKQTVRREGAADGEEWRPARIRSVRFRGSGSAAELMPFVLVGTCARVSPGLLFFVAGLCRRFFLCGPTTAAHKAMLLLSSASADRQLNKSAELRDRARRWEKRGQGHRSTPPGPGVSLRCRASTSQHG